MKDLDTSYNRREPKRSPEERATHNAYMKAWSATRKDQIKEYTKKYCARPEVKARVKAYQKKFYSNPENLAKVKAYRKLWGERNRERQRLAGVKRRQIPEKWEKMKLQNRCSSRGITTVIFDKMYAIQNGGCGICGKKISKAGNNVVCAHIDHDHSTGKVRGLLCQNCNHGLGNFQDNITFMYKAIEYIKHNTQTV